MKLIADRFENIGIGILLLLAFLYGVGYGTLPVGTTNYFRLLIGAAVAACVFYRPVWGMYLLAFVSPFIPNTMVFMLGVLVVGAFIFNRMMKGGFSLYPFSSEPSLLCFLLILVISIVGSFYFSESIRDIVIFVGALGIMYGLVQTVDDRDQLYKLGIFAVSAAFLVSLYGIYQFIIGVPADSAWVDAELQPWLTTRVYSVFGNPNVLAGYLNMLIPVSMALLFTGKDRNKRLLFGGITGTLLLCVLLTFSRSGWLGAAAAVLSFLWFTKKKGLVILMIILLSVGILSVEPLYERAVSMFDVRETSHHYRLIVWREVTEMIADHWMVGVGLGHLVFREIYPYYMITRGKMPYHAHNTFLQFSVEMGVIGLLVFLWLMFRVFKRGFDTIARAADPLISNFTAAGLAAVFGILVQGLGDHVIYMPKTATWFWIVVGLVFLCPKLLKRNAATYDQTSS